MAAKALSCVLARDDPLVLLDEVGQLVQGHHLPARLVFADADGPGEPEAVPRRKDLAANHADVSLDLKGPGHRLRAAPSPIAEEIRRTTPGASHLRGRTRIPKPIARSNQQNSEAQRPENGS